ncbi:hypothetical protein AMAG_20435 [Allomyces macrogynus ATCC 38327]|uniref:Uncharacterized protein n=1 Tax=Allomyces macrogynus (strain ATCC 38327) TaxID=578462 RepID=A0A0L0TBH7_ALLM3|nr:hypothetical protein AMAG_20435 [Allomyces macrogynus ATCC 38327]|eukprot:KNE72066.1 hypothetical protein AMAG_20435 [Allomyces macrogynus ATCC 38327]
MADDKKQGDAAGGAAEKLNTIQKNRILVETIRKEMRRHELYDHYMLSPNLKKSTFRIPLLGTPMGCCLD